jgi:hypothetical protein
MVAKNLHVAARDQPRPVFADGPRMGAGHGQFPGKLQPSQLPMGRIKFID